MSSMDNAGRMTVTSAISFRLAATIVAIICLLTIDGGCRHSSSNTVPVRGKVSYKGKPLTFGAIYFQPVDAANGRPAVASINPDGTYVVYTLKDSPGLVPGEYTVSVNTTRMTDLDRQRTPRNSRQSDKSKGSDIPLYLKYANRLTVHSGEKEKVFDINFE